MHGMRRQHDAAAKVKIAFEGIKGEKAIARSPESTASILTRSGCGGIGPWPLSLWCFPITLQRARRTMQSSRKSFLADRLA